MNDGKLPIAPRRQKKGAAPGGAALGKLFCQSSLMMAQAMDSTDAMVTPFSA